MARRVHLFSRLEPHFRLRHFRGHGIHSPFAYALYRNVFMGSDKPFAGGTLYADLTAQGISPKTARKIVRAALYLGYGEAVIDAPANPRQEKQLIILTEDTDPEKMLSLAANCSIGTTICIAAPRSDCERWLVCRKIIAAHTSLSLDCRGFMLLFYDSSLSKQHIKF